MGSKSDPPPPPDYVGAANTTAAGNLEAARAATQANRVNQVTPQGTQTWTHDPKAGSPDSGWTQTTSLSPEQQSLYNKDIAIKGGLGDVATRGLGYVQNTLNSPFDKSKLAAEAVNPGETAQSSILRRMQPQLDRDREALHTQLLNQGLQPGSAAYDTAMRRADQQSNDAYSQAALQGISVGQQARQQGIQEQNFFRNEPVNMLNAVRSGAQVQSPVFGMVPQQQTTAGPDVLSAVSRGYDAQVANSNAQNAAGGNMMSGLFSLGSAALPYVFPSDVRLKKNIVKLGALPNGVGIYEYEWKTGGFGKMIGVLAQEVQKLIPEAVRNDPSGFLVVDYRMAVQ